MNANNESRGTKRKSPCTDQQPTLRDFLGRKQRLKPDKNDSSDSEMSLAISLSLQREAVVTQEDAQTSCCCCPVCDRDFNVGLDEFQEHVNKCLDENEQSMMTTKKTQVEKGINVEQDNTANSSNSSSDDGKLQQPSSSAKATSWTGLFRKLPWKVTGIWSAKDDDVSSGSSTDWFGEESKPWRERSCPLYKKLPDTDFVVDAFSYGSIPDCKGYFLSHFHSDHYGGLSKRWEHGPIYCSKITGNCLQKKLQVNPEYINPLPMDQECPIPGSNVTVCLIDANHCPGSVLFLFKVTMPDGSVKRYLHTGDFRANPRMCIHPALKQPDNPPIDILFLDTTYLNPRYAFPAQDVAIDAACKIVRIHAGLQPPDDEQRKAELTVRYHVNLDRWFDRIESNTRKVVTSQVKQEQKTTVSCTINSTSSNGEQDAAKEKEPKPKKNFVVVVGSYALGKERIFCRLAKELNSKIFVTEAKRQLLECIESAELNKLLTDNQMDAQVHVIPIRHLQPEYLIPYMNSLKPHFEFMLAFRPTGWTFRSSAAQTSDMSCSSLARITASPVSFPELQLKPIFSTNEIKLYGVPYSEHSSFRELAAFVASLRVRRIVPTVNVSNESSRKRMGALFQKWQEEKQKNGKVQVVPFSTLDHW